MNYDDNLFTVMIAQVLMAVALLVMAGALVAAAISAADMASTLRNLKEPIIAASASITENLNRDFLQGAQ